MDHRIALRSSKNGEVMKPANTKPALRGPGQRPASEEPRTGVVRRVDVSRAAPDATRKTTLRPRANTSGAWRCLEWGERPSQPPPQHDPEVSIAQVSTSGRVLRETGPDAWLPDAADFVHRMALLVAQGLGFDRCRGVCLRSATAVLSVSEAGPTRVVGVSGPQRRMRNVLSRAGLE